MPPTLEQNLLIRGLLRRDLDDYGAPGRHLRRPSAIANIRLPSGALVRPLAAAGGALGAGQTVARLWPWVIEEGNNQRQTCVSPRFAGPALVDSLSFIPNSSPAHTILDTIELYYSADGGGAGLAALIDDKPSGVPLFLPQSRGNPASFNTNDSKGVPVYFALPQPAGYITLPLRALVPLDSFFLKISIPNHSAASTASYQGYVRVIEGFDPDLLGF